MNLRKKELKLKKFIEENSILNQIFEVFVFEEDVVATGKQSDEIYLEKQEIVIFTWFNWGILW